MRRLNIFRLLIALTVLLLTACGGIQVDRVDPDKEIALTDQWNDKDSALVAEEMITDMVSFPWLREYELDQRRKPTVIVQRVQNRSHEHIPVATFINELKRSMIRSGRVDFVVGGEERDAVRQERLDQELNASAETQAAIAEETGANFALSGSIDSIVDELDGKRATFYQVDLKLIDMTKNIEVWNGQKKLKKLQRKTRFGF